MKNILDNLHDALGVIKTTQNASAIGGAITGMSIVATVGYAGLSEYLPRFVALILTTGAVVMVLFVVDYGLRKTLPLGFDLLISGQWFRDWRTGVFLALLLSFNFMQAFSSIKLSWEGRKEAVAAIQQAPELDDVVQLKRQVDQTGSAKIRAMDSEVAKLRNDIQRKKDEIKKLYPTYIEKIESGQDKYAWHAGQLGRKRESKELNELETQLTALLSARTKAIEAETETSKTTIANIAATNTAKWGEYEISKNRNMAYIGYFGAGCTFVLIITSLMLSLLGQSNVTEIEQRDIVSPIRKEKNSTPPHVAPAKTEPVGDFETVRAIEMLRAETERLKRETEKMKRKPETVETETETVTRPVSVSVSPETFPHETVKAAVKEAVRETRPETVRETVETVRETVKAETAGLKRLKPETVKLVPPKRKRKPETVETVKVKRECQNPNCKKDISHKRSTAKYCDTKCKNAAHNSKR